ncbi:hypothetical protein SB5439_04989 [Klebsiella variicola]|uniref:head-tail connector protein n=1 Tax=Klebsiella variicola TaxID=244366 RepID=UPI00109C9618|nr:head-tail connector protein [Klebsiella variicola]VGQ11734.1 hypothetical protein SB5439_04989 [Klebsiella variicola]
MITVSLDEVKNHLRIDHDIFDNDLTLKLQAAEARVLAHCQGTDFNKLNDQEILLIKAAMLNLIGFMDRVRAGEERDDKNYLPPSVHQLLMPFRTPGII